MPNFTYMYLVEPGEVSKGIKIPYALVDAGSGNLNVNALETGGVQLSTTQLGQLTTVSDSGANDPELAGQYKVVAKADEANGGQGFILQNTTNNAYYFVTNVEYLGRDKPFAEQLFVETGGSGNQPCFVTGTKISTSSGEVPVEDLKVGDIMLTSDGKALPVRWIGRRTVSRLFADPLRALPIRVRAGALGDNVPSRDLLLSPDHALLVDDVLIQAGALVNGTSIVREENAPATFTYYHVELDDHSLILAENVPAETFVDNVGRMAFDNWDEFQALYPDGKAVVELPYPRAKAHRQVPNAIRERLAARSATLDGGQAASAA
jgi:hypothetical protein